jgi:hypothetical protein
VLILATIPDKQGDNQPWHDVEHFVIIAFVTSFMLPGYLFIFPFISIYCLPVETFQGAIREWNALISFGSTMHDHRQPSRRNINSSELQDDQGFVKDSVAIQPGAGLLWFQLHVNDLSLTFSPDQ